MNNKNPLAGFFGRFFGGLKNSLMLYKLSTEDLVGTTIRKHYDNNIITIILCKLYDDL